MINVEKPDFSNSPAAGGRPVFGYRPAEASPTPVVSVITPYYNTDAVFLETAKSVIAQSFQCWEWVIVDDGSTDAEALSRLRTAEEGDPRIRVIRQENAGPSAARNTAVRNSSGRYLCLLDSDDMLEPTFIEKCLWFLESNPGFGFCNSWSVNIGDDDFLWRTGFETGQRHLEANAGPPMAMIRRAAFDAAGGFDESIRFGHEDWDFWLALANAGYWGHTLPEFLEWYRRRSSGRFHSIMRAESANREFEELIAREYAGLRERFPAPAVRAIEPYPRIPSEFPFANPLQKPANVHRMLWLVPWMVTGGADKVNLDWIAALMRNGYQATVCATLQSHHDWMHEFAKLTPDVFVLPNFLRTVDYPRFLHYLIRSRQIDTVMITGSTFGYLVLPYLRAHLPDVAFVDLCHVEEPHWLNGGHPRFGVGYQEMLDLNLVTTAHLREWMIGRGGDPARIEVCHSGVDVARLDAAAAARGSARESLGLAPEIPVIVFAGRICEQKRPLFLADILHSLAARGLTFQALVIGDGDLRPAMEDRLRQLQPSPPVRMMGTVGHDGWLQALAASDIFLLPSQYEGISVALLEAMGMGLVPVSAAVGGQDAVMTPECGFLIPHGGNELEDYTNALARLLVDPSLRKAIGAAARRRIVEHFSLDATTATLLEGLERARRLAKTESRVTIGPGFATELATLAAEYTRLSVAADMLWAHWVKTRAGMAPVPALPEPVPPPPPTESLPQRPPPSGLERLGAALSETRPILALRRSSRLRAAGRWVLAQIEKQRAPALGKDAE